MIAFVAEVHAVSLGKRSTNSLGCVGRPASGGTRLSDDGAVRAASRVRSALLGKVLDRVGFWSNERAIVDSNW